MRYFDKNPVILFDKDLHTISIKLSIDLSYKEKLPKNFYWNINEDQEIVGIYYEIKPELNVAKSKIIEILKKLYKYYTEKDE